MSFNINSDKESIRGSKPKLIGNDELTIRSGSGSLEKEVFRAQLDANTSLPRIGINRTGERVNAITVVSGGSGYTQDPTVTISPPQTAGGVQALASAFRSAGSVVNIAINNPGSGYTSAPTVTITGGNGVGASATAELDTVDFELDINGAIRTSTSIISDTARVLNLDVDNFVTPDLELRGPQLKTYQNDTGTQWPSEQQKLFKDTYRYNGQNVYQILNTGETEAGVFPTHTDGDVTIGEVTVRHIGFRVVDQLAYKYQQTGEAGEFPRSITPLLGDRSDKIATTEYVLNLATNDVGGRIYVSEQIGSDLNDGRSAVNPVRTIKKAAQLAWATPGVKESIIVSGGDYLEDNPISLPPDASIVGDNLRLVIIRPRNPQKHMIKFGDKNYVIGVTYRDQVDANGDSVATWDFAMVFDDKQRICVDQDTNGDEGVQFNIGHQIFGPQQFRIGFQQNGGLQALQTGTEIIGTAGGTADVINVVFASTTGADAYLSGTVDVQLKEGSFVEGEQFRYITNITTDAALSLSITELSGVNAFRTTNDPTGIINGGDYVYLDDTDDSSFTQGYYQIFGIQPETGGSPTYWDVTVIPVFGSVGWTSVATGETININAATATFFTFDTTTLKSIRAEGEVVSVDEDITSTIPIVRLDFSLQGDPSIATGGFQDAQFGNAEDLGGIVFYTSELVGRTNTHDLKEGQEIEISGLPTANTPDISYLNGKQRIYKVIEDADGRARRFVIPKKIAGMTTANFDPGQNAVVRSYSKSVTLSLLNSPNKFPLATPVERRFQDACQLIRNNRDFIADEVVGIINAEFAKYYYSAYNISGTSFDIYLGANPNVGGTHTWVSGGTVTFGGATRNVTGFTWDNVVTGVATVTLDSAFAGPALAEDDTIKIENMLLQCDGGQKIYPSFSIPTSDDQCREDVVHFLNAIVRDLEFGTNSNVLTAASKYIVGGEVAYIEDEIAQNVRAFEYARELAIYAMCNWRIKNRTTADPLYVPRYSTLDRYFDPSVINTTALLNADGSANASGAACDDVRSAIDTLAYLWVDVISNNTSGTYLDAAYLISKNKDLIADQAYLNTLVQYPALGLSNVDERKCRRDIGIILNSVVRDLCLGGNKGTVTSAEAYFTGAALTGIDAAYLAQTIYAYEQVRDLAIAAMRNWSDGNVGTVTPTGSTYNPSTGALTVTFADPATAPVANSDRVAFSEGAITYSCAHSGGGNDESPYRRDANFGQSFLITNVSSSGGSTTISCNVGAAGSNTDAHTFVSALADGTKLIYAPVATTSPIPQFTDWSILEDSANPSCANVEATLTTLFALLEDILDGTVVPGATAKNSGTLFDYASIINYPDSFITDELGTRMAVRSDYDDYPIIEASPYTQNSSVISKKGGSGALVDGSKVKQPNCPFPGLELDGSATFPNQGKSMVASAFTIVSEGGTGYKVIEDGYTQLVSVFVIFCADGVLCESGGYASITNSATNFGLDALRATGFRRECYEFDQGTVANVSSTPAGRTIISISGLGREPLEHYIVKIDGFRNTDENIEYFIDSVGPVAVDNSADLTIDSGLGQPMDLTDLSTGNPVPIGNIVGATIKLHRPSIVNSSSHTWEFAGSGTTYNALPENGGTKDESREQVSENYGRVYVSGTDELGDFKVGTFAKIENRTGSITFTGTVTISEVEFLKLKGGDVVVTGFSADNTLGGANSSNSVLPTQKAVRDYITNNLGPYINKPYSTNAVPRALVELTDSGKISIDQIPALRPFEVYTVANQTERLAIEGALAGDIAIQQDTSTSFILNNDLDSQFLAFDVDPTVQFTLGDIFTGSVSGGRIQATEYRTGVVHRINITDGGSGYTSPPAVTFAGGAPGLGAISCAATTTIANGEVVTITIVEFNGLKGGKGYTSAPTVNIAGPSGAGTGATATAFIESRLYGDVVNRILIADTDTFDSSDIPPVTIDITRVVNTSSNNNNNWVSLSSNQIAATDITSGVIETDRLASGGAANSFTFLRGDQNFALAVQSIKGSETRYFAKLLSQANSGSSQLEFATNSDVLVGHEVKNTVVGIQANTNITGVITDAQLGGTTISLNNPITQNIAAGTIIEFERGGSPMVFESSYTQGNFVDSIIIVAGGNGFTDGQYFDVDIDSPTGVNGTGLRANFTVSGGAVTAIAVTDSGTGYSGGDFSVTAAPAALGPGSNLVLAVKISTVNRQYANVSLDVQRVSDLTVSSDLFGTIGVVRLKKSQFDIGVSGNGSVTLKTGQGSGLDADLLDGAQGSFYRNATNINAGTLNPDRLSGTYSIDISGRSTDTIKLITGTNNPTSSPTPNNFSEGIVANTINNNADSLFDGGTQHLVLTIRNKGQGLTAEGGVRQLAFTDNDNMYLRGSGTGVTAFGSWAKIWSSLNDGVGSGLDADRLDGRQGTWYQSARNINYGQLSDNRIPGFMSSSIFRDDIAIKSYNGDPSYNIYVAGKILTTTPFVPGTNVFLYNAQDQSTGEIAIDNITTNNVADATEDFTIITGRLTSGSFTAQGGAIKIGTAAINELFDEYYINDANTIQVATLESDGGTGNLRLGRKDGVASSPGIYLNSSVQAANYNVALVATGGNATDGSGTLNAQVINANGFTINGNTIWNNGNIQFQSSNIANTAVKRDGSGNFSAGTITGSLTGAASENVLKAGDTMTGNLTISGGSLTVSNASTFQNTLSVTNDFAVDSDTLFVDVSTDRVGINASTNPIANLDVKGDDGIYVRTNTSGGASGTEGARIRFTTRPSDTSQNGTLKYSHLDSQSPSSDYGEGFTFQGTETELYLRVVGDILASRKMGVGINREPNYTLEVNGTGFFQTSLTIDSDNDNSGAPIYFRGSSSQRNFRIGNQIGHSNAFEITASSDNGGTSWKGTPGILVKGDNRVSINTNSTSGTDPTNNVNRNYYLNVQGDMNLNGQFFQNNQEFVTSRWTEASNGNDIYRLSNVGINRADPQYTLHVNGTMNIEGSTMTSQQVEQTLHVNGDRMWLDPYGVIKVNRNSINQSITVNAAQNASSTGPITINNGVVVTIANGGVWSIV